MTRTAPALLALLLLAAVRAAPAQEAVSARNGLREGAWSLSFGLPLGGGPEAGAGLGAWRMVSARTNLGVELDAYLERADLEDPAGRERERETARAALGVAARRYLDLGRAVAPFLTGRAGAGLFREAVGGDDVDGTVVARGWGADVRGGAGVEWFPARSVSVSGSTGVGIGFDRTRSRGGPEPGDARSTTVSVGTFTTELGFRIYF
jgi:opacity protein-like surface antigen